VANCGGDPKIRGEGGSPNGFEPTGVAVRLKPELRWNGRRGELKLPESKARSRRSGERDEFSVLHQFGRRNFPNHPGF